MTDQHSDYQAWVKQRLDELRPVLASAVVGDFSTDLEVPHQEDEFTEVFVGVKVMTEVIREQLEELTQINKKLELTAAERSASLAEAQALTHLGSWQWDIASNKISWSDELYRIYGLKPQSREVGFEEFLSFIHPDDAKRVQQIIGSSFQTGESFEFEHRIIVGNKQEKILFGMGKVVKNEKGEPERMVGTSQDITERKKVEHALRQSDQRFKAVSRATNDLVYDHDVRTGTIWFNEVLTDEYGYPQKNVNTFKWWVSCIHPADVDRVKKSLDQLLKSKKNTWSIEYRLRRANDGYASVINRAFVLRDADGKPSRMIGSLLDVTQQKQLERAKDEFISLASHQLRTPLTIIRLYSEMLSGRLVGEITEDQEEHVQKITDASVRLISLVNDMLDISRIELERIKIEAVPTDVNDLIQIHIDELSSKAEECNITVNFKPDTKLKPIVLDATIFSQIVYNLLDNALNYTGNKGKVDISFTCEKDSYVLKVKDNGIGIPKDAQKYIFDRFYRASNSIKVNTSGSGLGLYLVKLIADIIGGSVWFDSSLDKGTTFYVSIPLSGMEQMTSNIDRSTESRTETTLAL